MAEAGAGGARNATGSREDVLFEIFGYEVDVLTVVIAGGVALVVCCFCMLCCVWWCRRKCRQRRERRANKPAVAGKVQEMSGRRMKKNPMAKKVLCRKRPSCPKGGPGS